MAESPTPKRSLDPVTFEVLRGSFEYICERMSQVLQKASFSPIIYDIVDFSNAIFDPNIELIGQTANCPVHIAAMHFSARESLERFPADGLEPGDVVLLNDPYKGGTHTPDMTFTTPIFHHGEIVAFAVSRAHWTDVGLNLDTHIGGEGLRIPPRKICRAGVLDEDLVEMIENMTRTPHYVVGDIQAQLGALWAARDEVVNLAERYGAATLRQGMSEILDYTEQMTRAAIRRIPDGSYQGYDSIESDGFSEEPLPINIRLVVDGDSIHADLSGTAPQTMGPINSPYANTASAIYYSLKFFLSSESPPNAGMYRAIDMTIPEGSWLNPVWPAATFGCTTTTSSKITSAIWSALAKAIPEQVVASTYSDANWFIASVNDPETGERHVFSDLPAGGWGGTPYNDGMHVTMDPLGNCQNMPAETAELLFPVRWHEFEMLTDSPGAGTYRGGAGVRLEFEFLGRGEIVTMETSRTREGSPGVNGGHSGSRQRQLRRRHGGGLEVIGGLVDDGSWLPQMLGNVGFSAGERFVFHSGGGGGWGNPVDRDPQRVLADVRDEIISTDAARAVYGVVVADGEVDAAATDELRAAVVDGT